LRLWWALAAAAALSLAYGATAAFKRDRAGAAGACVVGGAAAIAAWVWHTVAFEADSIPIYAYGVMLGVSLVVGWYLTLTLAERDGLPRETAANCYVVTAVVAIAGSRLLFVVTNADEFHSLRDVVELRNGGYVAYGGFIAGLLASWAYLAPKKIRLLAWADAAVPSLASGLFVTRIGCYLFGCDFGKRLPDGAPGWLKSLGTFPHWAPGTMPAGDGSPAYVRHLALYRGSPLEADLVRANASFPVHPTQIYESLVGLALVGLLLWQRRSLRFRGQLFFLFVFAYGFCRFVLELWRDDVERGSYGPVLDEHVYVPACLFLFAVGFLFGVSRAIDNERVRVAARVSAFLPAVVAYLALRPATFAGSEPTQLSTSQIIGLTSALAVSLFYARFWDEARTAPAVAMSLGDEASIRAQRGASSLADDEDDELDDEDDGDADAAEPPPVRPLGKAPAESEAS
jgi:phosphatidylglycerol:prolipoprotein diacylglycerol transferase